MIITDYLLEKFTGKKFSFRTLGMDFSNVEKFVSFRNETKWQNNWEVEVMYNASSLYLKCKIQHHKRIYFQTFHLCCPICIWNVKVSMRWRTLVTTHYSFKVEWSFAYKFSSSSVWSFQIMSRDFKTTTQRRKSNNCGFLSYLQ